jgi:SAM-dependent methyltransferase
MEWFEDESFWEQTYPFMFGEQRFLDAVDEAEKIVKLVEIKGSKVLDLCCGPGRLSLAFADRGFAVTGVDRTEFLLQKARTRAQSTGADIEWVRSDMRDFVRCESFDFIVNMFTSFGYFDDKSDDMKVLQNIFQSLKPGGSFLIDVMGKEILARIYQPTTSEVLDDGTKLIHRHEVFDDWTRVRCEWIHIKEGIAKSFHFHHTIYSAGELKDRMEQTGFKNIQVYGDLDANPYDQNAKRLILIGRK